MRLAPKVFLVSLVSLIALGVVAGWSLLAIDRLVDYNQSVASHSAEALRIEAEILQALPVMERYHRAYGVDWFTYATLFDRRAEKVEEDLTRLYAALIDPEEERLWHQAQREFREYHAMIGLPGVDDAYREFRDVLTSLNGRTREVLWSFLDQSSQVAVQTRQGVTLGLAVGVLAALVLSIFFSVRVTQDLRRLSAAAGEVASGTFAGELPIRRRDEVGELALAFQQMAGQLKEIDRSKEEFFAQVSHEFRTPLTAMREATSLLSDRVAGPLEEKQERLIDILGASCERLLRLVNQILELSRLRARLQMIEPRRVELAPLMDYALDELRPQAEARKLDLAADAPDRTVAVEGDEEQLTEVFVNLVGNAIKFTPEGGEVRVRLGSHPDDVEIEVGDNGQGISADALPHIFDRFWQATDKDGGSGLGLAIVKSIVEAHGGKVWGESELGQGTRFTVRLPRAA